MLTPTAQAVPPPFDAGLAALPDELREALAEPLIDHHAHGCLTETSSRSDFEQWLNEGSPEPVAAPHTPFDGQLGFAVRRWCAPLLGLPPHAAATDYWSARSDWPAEAVARALLPAAGVRDWLLDTGFAADRLTSPARFADWSGGRTREVLRLETLAEQLVDSGTAPAEYPAAFRDGLAAAAGRVVAAKTIAAYRCGFAIDWSEPDDATVAAAAARWTAGAEPGRLTSPTLIAFGVHAAARAGLPLQIHVGLGDRDLDLRLVDPLRLRPLLAQPHVRRVLLLHCYPYVRAAGYLAQAFDSVHLDVGLAVHHVGARSAAVVAEALELAPFDKLLYSSDGCGPPELHLLGSVLWRRAMARVLGRWVAEGDWSTTDAARVARMIGSGNAERVYASADRRWPPSVKARPLDEPAGR